MVPSVESYDPEVHLNEADVSVGSKTKPPYIEVRIKASKTDIFRRGVTVYLGTTGNDLCPVTAVLSYMASIQRLPTMGCGPFFRKYSQHCSQGELRQQHTPGTASELGPPQQRQSVVCQTL